jgi:C4-dicarboxylate transporter DctM subunit
MQATFNELHKKGLRKLLRESFFALLTPVIILGSIYGGVASPTEAAAISVIYAIIVSVFIYRTVSPKELGKLIVEGARTYILILFIIAAAIAFGKVITLLQYPQRISEAILSSVSSKVGVILIINLILLIFGMFVDNIPNIMVLTPILLPVATSVGMHPVHFGIMITANLAIGMVTPPMGINLYVANSMTQIPILKIAKVAIPFLISFLIALMFISFIPWLSLKLPGLM